MSQATHVYRNKRNGRLGEMTEEQAAIWPRLLERVDAEAAPEIEVHVEEKIPDLLIDPRTPKAPTARSTQKD